MGRTPSDCGDLTRIPLFADLTPEVLNALIRHAQIQDLPSGRSLFKEGQRPQSLHVLLSGSVQAFAATPGDSRESIIEIAAAPDCFVVAAVLTDQPYLMSATVLESARLLLVPAENLRKDLADHPELARTLIATLSNQNRRLVGQIKDLKLRSTIQRVGAFLLNLSQPRPDATAVVQLPYDKQLIASHLGMTRESFSRALAALRDYGVETKNNRILLRNPAELASYCGSDIALERARPLSRGDLLGREPEPA